MKRVDENPLKKLGTIKTNEVDVHVIEEAHLPINIEFNGMVYRLNKTKNGKLILTK